MQPSRGTTEVHMRVRGNQKTTVVRLDDKLRVNPGPALHADLKQLALENGLRCGTGGWDCAVVLVRREMFVDADAIRAVTTAAFAKPGQDDPAEAPLVDRLRACPAWIPELSLVAVGPGGEVVGHVVCSRGTVYPGNTGQASPVLALGPLSVRPESQGKGVGKALMHAVLGAADALGETMVVLLGHPTYYPKFGFRLASEYGITPKDPEWAPYFQVRTLTAYDGSVQGEFAFPEPFDRLPAGHGTSVSWMSTGKPMSVRSRPRCTPVGP